MSDRQSISAIHAPYNFVPLHEKVFIPEWAGKVSHDKPFLDGLCGELELSITAQTPILVGNERTVRQNGSSDVNFHRAPDDRYMIPGSTLRGAIRNVLEIATFSRMRFVDDRALSIRDLTPGANEIYGSYFTSTEYSKEKHSKKKRTFVAKSNAAWLSMENSKPVLHSCKFSRVEQELLESYANNANNALNLGGRGDAKGKYKNWEDAGLSLSINFIPGSVEPHQHSKGKWLKYSKAESLGSGSVDGHLVFTGQPMARNGASGRKHMEFIFHGDEVKISLPDNVWRDFKQVHEESNDWSYWVKKLSRGERMPVFYLCEDEGKETGIKAIGLAQMFRLAYSHSIHDAVCNSAADHLEDKGDDLSALIFGYTDLDQGKRNLKGRVSFTPAFVQGNVQPQTCDPTILNGPKPSYYPSYIEQPQKESGKLQGGSYKTLMDKDVRIRGFKRYPARPSDQVHVQKLSAEQKRNNRVQTVLHPLPSGTAFVGSLKFHNLRPEELGALIWALTWGQKKALRHSIGMGKPFGFGQIGIRIVNPELRANDPESVKLSPEECAERFVSLMDGWVKEQYGQSWYETAQMKNLLGMANPEHGGKIPGGTLSHMKLENKDFQGAKNGKLVLAAYVPTRPLPGSEAGGASDLQSQGSAVRRNSGNEKPMSLDYSVQGEELGKVVEVREENMLVRLNDGRVLERRLLVNGVKLAQIKVGLDVLAKGKGLYNANNATITAASASESGQSTQGTAMSHDAMKKKFASRFTVKKI